MGEIATLARNVEDEASASMVRCDPFASTAAAELCAHTANESAIAGLVEQSISVSTIDRKDCARTAGCEELAHMGYLRTDVVNAKAQVFAIMGYRRRLAKLVGVGEFASTGRIEKLAQSVKPSSARYRVACPLDVGTPVLYRYGDTCRRSTLKIQRP